jgi:hypothetical protein
MKEKLLYYMSFVTILIAMIGMVYFIYLQLYPFKVVELKEFKVFNTEVKAGSPAKVLVVFKKNNPFTSETQWNLICDKNGDLSYSKRKYIQRCRKEQCDDLYCRSFIYRTWNVQIIYHS